MIGYWTCNGSKIVLVLVVCWDTSPILVNIFFPLQLNLHFSRGWGGGGDKHIQILPLKNKERHLVERRGTEWTRYTPTL